MVIRARHANTLMKVAIKVIYKNEIYQSSEDIPEIVLH